jgi:alkanesulfonate monooxygenase SsuD/methylene tetrahydromethanopterin reductase-like flavin-dependent oxidoreductase (luciferase family)
VVRAVQRAEALGLDTVWTAERLLSSVKPRTPYPATADGSLLEYSKRAMDPLETVTFVAAHTRPIGLGTSVVNMPFSNPVMLARRLATLDAVAAGRLRVGLGPAWSADELEAAGRHRASADRASTSSSAWSR